MSLRKERISVLDVRLAEVDRKLPRQPSDLLKYLTRSELHTLLRVKRLLLTGAVVARADSIEIHAMELRAAERKEAGCNPLGMDLDEQMERIRWHQWAAKNGIRFAADDAGQLQPTQMMPSDD